MFRQTTIEQSLKAIYALSMRDLTLPTHRQAVVDARTALIHYLYTHYHLTQRDIAQRLHLNQSNINRALKRHKILIQFDPNYRQKYEALQRDTHQTPASQAA